MHTIVVFYLNISSIFEYKLHGYIIFNLFFMKIIEKKKLFEMLARKLNVDILIFLFKNVLTYLFGNVTLILDSRVKVKK